MTDRRATREVWTVKDWPKHQHYKAQAGAPTWIKLYVALLDDEEFRGLSVYARDLLRDIWLIAARLGKSGTVPADPERIAWFLRCSRESLESPLRELLSGGWITGSVTILDQVKSKSREGIEQRRGEEKEERRFIKAEESRLSPATVTEYAALMQVIPEAYGPAVAGYLRAANSPAAVRACVESYMNGLHGKYGPDIIGRALADMQANGEPFKARTLDVFCGALKRRPSGSEADATPAERLRQMADEERRKEDAA